MRDMRLWHRGVPNPSAVPRPMLALILASGWMGSGRTQVPAAGRAFFRHPDLAMSLDFVERPIDYLHRHNPYDYAP